MRSGTIWQSSANAQFRVQKETKGRTKEYLQHVFLYDLLPHVGDNYTDKL